MLRESKDASMKARKFDCNGIELELLEGGQGQPLLYLHGLLGAAADEPFTSRLSQSFSVFAPSHPGFGQSGLPAWIDRMEDIPSVYLDLLDALDLRGVVLVGSSIGGWIAADLATRNASHIDRLILISPLGIKVGDRDHLDIPDIFAMDREDARCLAFSDPQSVRRDLNKLSDDALATEAREREALALLGWEPYMHDPKLKHRLHRIKMPTLFLRGTEDHFISPNYAESYAALIPGARFAAIKGAGHLAGAERPGEVTQVVCEFSASKTAHKMNRSSVS